MMNSATSDRKATADEVRAHAAALRQLAEHSSLGEARVRDDGRTWCTLSPATGAVLEFAAQAAAQIGTYVHAITDDAPGGLGHRGTVN